MPQSTQSKGQPLAVVSRSWTNLQSLNSSFSLTSLGVNQHPSFWRVTGSPFLPLVLEDGRPVCPSLCQPASFCPSLCLEAAGWKQWILQPQVLSSLCACPGWLYSLALKWPNCQSTAGLSSWVVQGLERVPPYTLSKCSPSVTAACQHAKTHHQTQTALVGASSKDGQWAPQTSGVNSSFISDFSVVRISTTNWIRQVVGTVVSSEAPPILETFFLHHLLT